MLYRIPSGCSGHIARSPAIILVDAGHPNINSTTSEFRERAIEKHDVFEIRVAVDWRSLYTRSY
jgi:hypothetical protein